MKKIIAWVDQFLEGKTSQNQENKLRRKYFKILRFMAILLIIEFGIGKINGGEKVEVLGLHGEVTALDNDQLKAKVVELTTLQDGATRIIFELDSPDYDYQKKEVKATSNKTKLQGAFINNRFYWVQTPPTKEITPVHVSLTSLTGEGQVSFMDYDFNLKAEIGKDKTFTPIEARVFDLRLLDEALTQTQKDISQKQGDIKNKNQKIKDEQAEIKALELEQKASKVKTEQEAIFAQITTYQDGINSLSLEISDLQSQMESSQAHLQQLQEEKQRMKP